MRKSFLSKMIKKKMMMNIDVGVCRSMSMCGCVWVESLIQTFGFGLSFFCCFVCLFVLNLKLNFTNIFFLIIIKNMEIFSGYPL